MPTIAVDYFEAEELGSIVFKVLKSQRWKKKKEASAYEAKDTSPEGRVSTSQVFQLIRPTL